MRTGKLPEAALKRSVLRQLYTEQAAVRERYGADCAALPQADGDLAVYTAVGTVPGFEDRPAMLVTAAANNLAAGGAEPHALAVHAMLPPSCEEAELRAGMKQIAEAAGNYGMQVICGHTEVSEAVNRPVYQVTGIGHVCGRHVCSAEPGRGETRETDFVHSVCETASEIGCVQRPLCPSDTLVLTKWIALGGTAALANRYGEELEKRFPFSLVDRARSYEALMSVVPEARIAAEDYGDGTCTMHDLSQGGIFGALWEMAERGGVGLEVDLKRIPVRQETIEICEYFDINPYCLYSAGALLIGTKQPESLLARLREAGIEASVIGRATDGNDRIVRNGEDVRFLDRPGQDEWYAKAKRGGRISS